MYPGPTATLEEAREWLRAHLDEGAACPLCTQHAKVYRRKITAGIAAVLVRMWRKAGTEWVYLPSLRSRGQDEAIARYWGLIEQLPDAKREDGSTRVGWWRLTPLGVEYVHNRARVPKYARIYAKRCLGMEGEAVGIRDALGTCFNYAELMAGV